MIFKTRYRIVENRFGFDPQYKPWWSPFWLPIIEGDEFARSRFDKMSAREVCQTHYEYSLKQNIEYFDPSETETK